MRIKGSRYVSSRVFNENKEFKGFRERKLSTPPGLVEHALLHTDRLDHMANDYYKKDRRWWRILDANSEFMYGFDLLGMDFVYEEGVLEEDKIQKEDIYGDLIAIPAARDTNK